MSDNNTEDQAKATESKDKAELPPAEEAKSSFFEKLKKKFSSVNLEEVLDDTSILAIENDTIKKGFDKTVRIINSKVVKKTTDLAKGILNITEKVKEGNVISAGAATVASLELFSDFFEIERLDTLDIFTSSKGLLPSKKGHLVEMLLSPNILSSIKKEVFWEEKHRKLLRCELGEGNYIYLLQLHRDDGDSANDLEFYKKYFIDSSFSYPLAYKCFWEFFDNKIYLTNRNDGSSSSEHLRLNPLSFTTYGLLISEEEINKIGEEISRCHKDSVSRSYLLVGPPGTGKSSFCFAAAEKFCPRILKVDPSVMYRMESGELEYFIDCLLPDAIIFDDIDRCDTEGYLLFVLENIKKTYPNVVVFATANSFEELGSAMVRPGRFDRVLWLDNPNFNERDSFIRHYAKVFELDIPENVLSKAISETEGFSQAYLIEMLLRCKYDAIIEESLEGSIKEFKRTLRMDVC